MSPYVAVLLDMAEAAIWYRKAAERGHRAAQFNLGVLYCTGNGVKPDRSETVKWWRKAAMQGHAQACYNLAVCYVTGDGIQRDAREAGRYFQLAQRDSAFVPQLNLTRVFFCGGEAQ